MSALDELRNLPNKTSALDQLKALPATQGELGFDPEVSDPSLQWKARQDAQPFIPDEVREHTEDPRMKLVNSGEQDAGRLSMGDSERAYQEQEPLRQDINWKNALLQAGFQVPRVVMTPIARAAGYKETINPALMEGIKPTNKAEEAVFGFARDWVGNAPFYALGEGIVGQGLAKLGGAGLGAISKAAPKLAPAAEKAAPYVNTFMRGFGAGAPVSTMESLSEGASMPEALKHGAITGTEFGVFGAGLHGLGNAAKFGANKLQGLAQAKPKAQPLPEMRPKVTPQPKGNLTREGSISAAKFTVPEKMAEVGDGTKVRSLGVSAMKNPEFDPIKADLLMESMEGGAGTYGPITNKATIEQAQKMIAEDLQGALRTIKEDPHSALSNTIQHELATKAIAEGREADAAEIVIEAMKNATTQGQAVQAWRIWSKLSPEGMMKVVYKHIDDLNKEGAKAYGKKWKDVNLTNDELAAIGKIKKGDQKAYEEVFDQIRTRIADELPATAMEKVNAWRHVAMLLNPKTQIRNVGGNVLMMGMRRAAKQVSAAIQKAVLKPGERTQVFKIQQDYQKAAETFFEENKKQLLSGPSKYQENIKLNMPDKRVFSSNALEGTRKLTYKLLEMGDTPFFKNAYVNRLASYAQAKGIKDFSKLPDEAFAIALKEAEQATYKDANIIADALNKWKNPGADASIYKKAGAFLLEGALPFTKTPLNIVGRGIQYSPGGILNGIYKWKSQKLAAEGIDELAKGLTGTAIIGLGYLLAKANILTGKESEDADLKAYDANTGNAPFSILGKFTYDWMQPFSVPLSVGVEIYNAIKDDPLKVKQMEGMVQNNDGRWTQVAKSMTNAVVDALTASGDTVFNMSVLKSVKYLLGNQQGVMAGLADLPQNYASQFIPTAASQLAGTIDPTVRQTYVKGNWPASMKGVLLNKIPGASKTLPAKQTPFGEDMQRAANPFTRALSQFVSPGIIAVNQKIDPAIDAELRRLNSVSGLKTQMPTMTPNYIEATKNYPKLNLTQEEATKYQKITGQKTLANFRKTMSSGSYINAKTDEKKAELLAKEISKAKAEAKAEIVKSRGYKPVK